MAKGINQKQKLNRNEDKFNEKNIFWSCFIGKAHKRPITLKSQEAKKLAKNVKIVKKKRRPRALLQRKMLCAPVVF